MIDLDCGHPTCISRAQIEACVAEQTRHVLGVDLSLASTGVAAIRKHVAGWIYAETLTIASAGRRSDNLTMRWARLARITSDVVEHATGVDLVVIEGPSIMSQHGSAWDRAGLWWQVVTELLDAEIPVAVVPPTVVKKFATDRGNADKAAVAVGMSRLWPTVEATSDNEWDALALAHIGAQRLGMDVPSRAHHADAVAKIAWPELEVMG